MNAIIGIIYVLVTGYHIVNFAKVLGRMNEKTMFPIDDYEVSEIRIIPEKPLDPPTYKAQKWGIIVYAIILVFLLVVFFIAASFKLDQWSVLLILLLPLIHSRNLMNMFVLSEDGILTGGEFIPWKSLTSFEFKRIDINHKYYGYSKDVNDTGYELVIKKRFFSISCIVLTDEMKEKLTRRLSEHIIRHPVDLQS
ncbi:hypothetical protein [Paucisalibacillus globulus]|uniref:hypothetical protein n=1 Tax=Paucisalibacillus globulus TaxID=351095 RepID=UPI0003FEC459|nr:hypothetical protein [Paucisalibacillus globulus]